MRCRLQLPNLALRAFDHPSPPKQMARWNHKISLPSGTKLPQTRRFNQLWKRRSRRAMLPEIVIFDKLGGPLTKRICLDESGAAKSDGSACVMSRGMATRTPVESVVQLGAIIGSMQPHQAIALGSLRRGLPLTVDVTTKR